MPYFVNLLRGIVMGAAGVIPGGDGGTVALVLGIFERLIASIYAGASALGLFVRGRFSEGRQRLGDVEWALLIPLLVGFAIAVVTLARLISGLLDSHPQQTAAAAFGLLAGAIVLSSRLVGRWTRRRLLYSAAAAAATFTLLGLRAEALTDPGLLAFFLVGTVAVSGMILPGVSGAAIMLAVGMYQPLLDAVNDRDLVAIGVFGIGAVIGLAGLAVVLNRWLRSHHDTLIACLVGFMVGALRILWPWPDGTDTAILGRPVDWGVPLQLAIGGFGLVLAIATFSRESPVPSPQQDD